jgi:hypothetical protein
MLANPVILRNNAKRRAIVIDSQCRHHVHALASLPP